MLGAETDTAELTNRIAKRMSTHSVRHDRTFAGKPIVVFDLKTGGARPTEARIVQIRDNLPLGYQNIPIIEIR